MKNAVIEAIEKKQIKEDIPQYKTADYVKVHAKIVEGKKERIQIFEGIVLKHSGRGLNATITVRKVVDGIGVEKTFPVHSQVVAKIEVVKYSKVRRARLFYLRELIGSKVMRVKEDLDKNIKAAASKAQERRDAAKQREEDAVKKREEEAKQKAEEEKAKKEAEAKAAAEAKQAEAVTEEPKTDETKDSADKPEA